MSLTEKQAKVIASKVFKKISNPEEREYRIMHAKAVKETALILAEGRKFDENVLSIAAWLHDIGYSISKENHAKHSLDLLKKYELDEKLKDCILNHGTDANPKTQEGTIFQLADKACILNQDILKLLIKQGIKKQDISFVRNMSEKACVLLDSFV